MGLYVTTNLHLANALATIGVPLASRRGDTATGEVYPAMPNECPEWREITVKQLEENGFATIEDAQEKGFIGTIAYGFCDHEDRKDFLKAYNEVLHAKEKSVRLNIPDFVTIKDAEGESVTVKTVTVLAQFAALYASNLEMLAKRRPRVPAKLHLRNAEGHPVVQSQPSP